MKQNYQGDILFQEIKEIPNNLKEVKHKGQFVVAAGEATGHHHKVITDTPNSVKIYQDNQDNYFLRIEKECQVVHQEHPAITLVPQIYRVVRQREWDMGEIRRVSD